jgi:hypothetical protein
VTVGYLEGFVSRRRCCCGYTSNTGFWYVWWCCYCWGALSYAGSCRRFNPTGQSLSLLRSVLMSQSDQASLSCELCGLRPYPNPTSLSCLRWIAGVVESSWVELCGRVMIQSNWSVLLLLLVFIFVLSMDVVSSFKYNRQVSCQVHFKNIASAIDHDFEFVKFVVLGLSTSS